MYSDQNVSFFTVVVYYVKLCVSWQPGWEGSLGEKGYMCMYRWVTLLWTQNFTMLLITYAPVYNKVLKNWCVSSRASRFYSAVNDSDGEFWSLPVFCLDHSRQHSPSLCTPSTLCAWSCAVSLHPCLASVTNFCDCSACSWNSPWRLSLPISIPVILRQFQGRF